MALMDTVIIEILALALNPFNVMANMIVWIVIYFKARKLETPLDEVSVLWYAFPFFLGWIGVLINYFKLKERNHQTILKSIYVSFFFKLKERNHQTILKSIYVSFFVSIILLLLVTFGAYYALKKLS
jgi:hypothetical protein